MADGRVTVNGVTVRELGSKADASTDDIRVDGVRVRVTRETVYLLLNKPRGVLTTRRDPEGRATVMDLVPRVPGLFPVGRLDIATEGLLVLTNDGAWAERVLHPRYEVARVYNAKVRGVPDAKTLERLRRGIRVEGQHLAVDRVKVLEADNNAWLEVTLHEGKHHEVRRLLEAVGHPVSKLRRVGFGPLSGRGLAAGEFRALTPREVAALAGAAHRAPRPTSAPKPASRPRGGGRDAPRAPRPTGAPKPTSSPRRGRR